MAATRNLFRNEKILFLAKVTELSNREHTYNYIRRTNFNRDSPENQLKNLSTPTDKCLKLISYVLGTRTKMSD